MPESEIFIRPASLGLSILMVGVDVNFRVEAQLTDQMEDDVSPDPAKNNKMSSTGPDDDLPDLIPL